MISNGFPEIIVIVIFFIVSSVILPEVEGQDEVEVVYTVGSVKKKDLMKYATALERNIAYWANHTSYDTSSLYLGLSLMEVNLMNILKQRAVMLKQDEIDKLELIKNLNKRTLRKFDELIIHNKILGRSKRLLSLINDENVWSNLLPNFHHGAWEKLPPPKIKDEVMLYNFTHYYEAIHQNFMKEERNPVPNDTLSKCLDQLSNVEFAKEKSASCKDISICKLYIERVKDYGYGVVQKLLTLQMASYGRNCYFYDPDVDAELRLVYCQSIFEEVELIAEHGFKYLTDLFSEQVFLCALEGHVEFLERSWFSQLLETQNAMGCFENNKYEKSDGFGVYSKSGLYRERPRGTPKNIDICGERASGMMIGALSLAIRFILEVFYDSVPNEAVTTKQNISIEPYRLRF